jgi:hypothetical protein
LRRLVARLLHIALLLAQVKVFDGGADDLFNFRVKAAAATSAIALWGSSDETRPVRSYNLIQR